MSFVKELNLKESELLEQVLTLHLSGSDFLDKNFVNNLLLDFQDIYNIITRYNNDEAMIGYIRYRLYKAIKCYNQLGHMIEGMDKKLISGINKLVSVYLANAQKMVASNSDKQIYMRRMKLTVKRINNIKNDVGYSLLLELNSLLKEIVLELSLLEESIPIPISVKEETVKVDRNFKTRNIFSYKEMCKVAEENGYRFMYTAGSHMIYRHIDSHRIVVIPKHTLPKSLSIGIQQQINSRKVY